MGLSFVPLPRNVSKFDPAGALKAPHRCTVVPGPIYSPRSGAPVGGVIEEANSVCVAQVVPVFVPDVAWAK